MFSYICLQMCVSYVEWSFLLWSVLVLKENSEKSIVFLMLPLWFLCVWMFYTNVTVLQNNINSRGYVAPCERNVWWSWGLWSILSTLFTAPMEWWRMQKSSVGLPLWSEQTISHLQVSLVILCYFIRCESVYPSVPVDTEEVDQECDLTAYSLPSKLTCSADSGLSHFPNW